MAQADRQNGIVFDAAFGSSTVTVTAPTVAQIDALTRIECGLIDGPNAPRTGSTVDLTALCDQESSQKAGAIENGPITATLYREFDGTDAYWALFDDTTDPNPTQYLVTCPRGFNSGGDGTVTAGDVVDVYTVQVMKREAVGPVRGDGQRFMTELAVIATNFDVTVAA